MQQFNYPTTIYFGEGALKAAVTTIAKRGHRRLLLVTDESLSAMGVADSVAALFQEHGVETVLFDGVHPNPLEADVLAGAACYKAQHCDGIFSVGGGSPNDAAKVIAIAATHDEPLEKFEDCQGGDANVVHPLPAIYSAATTAGTGSEVGRSGLVTLARTGRKTIIFHPDLLPKIAILDPALTMGLPPEITASTGVDALSHNLEAYCARGFHPMADGIALQGIELVLDSLPRVMKDGGDVMHRSRMLLASAMGATAFQKGLGAAHSMSNALTAKFNTHHGTGIALVLPATLAFLERSVGLDTAERQRLETLQHLFQSYVRDEAPLSVLMHTFITSQGIPMGLEKQGVTLEHIDELSKIAFEDPTHAGNMLVLNQGDFVRLFRAALPGHIEQAVW